VVFWLFWPFFFLLLPILWGFLGTAVTNVNGVGILTNDLEGVKVIAAHKEGIVEEIVLQRGEKVSPGDVVLRLNLDGQTHDLLSFVEGEISELRVTRGEFVAQGTTIGTVTSAGGDNVVVAFLSAADGKRVTPGMAASIVPSTVNQEEYGSMPGTVLSVSDRPVSFAEPQALLQDEQLVNLLTHDQPPILVVIDVEEDSSSPNGFRWHAGSGPPFLITPGTLVSAAITVDKQRPISLIFPSLKGPSE